MTPAATARASAWFGGALVVLALGVVAGPVLAPLTRSMPQGSSDLLAYYTAWWLVTIPAVITVCPSTVHDRRTRSILVTTFVMLASMSVLVVVARSSWYSTGDYINPGLQGIYLALGVLIAGNAVLGALALRFGLGVAPIRSAVLAVVWALAFAASLVVVAFVVQFALVDLRRGSPR